MQKKLKKYVIGILIPVGIGLFSAFLSGGGMGFYESVKTPPLSPPGILFPIVWTVLYVLMGIGSALIYKSDAGVDEKSRALFIYALQLAFNFLWSILFFNKRAFLISFIWLALLWGLIGAMILSFKKINKTAAYLQLPYLVWVTFAGYLNFGIWLLNG